MQYIGRCSASTVQADGEYGDIYRIKNDYQAFVHRLERMCIHSVSLSEDNKYLEVVEALKHVPEVVECHFITGKAALFLKAYCFDNEHLMNMLINTIQHIPYVQATNTMISLDQAFEREVWVKDFNAVSFKTGSLTE